MQLNESRSFEIASREYWNDTGVILQKGFTYDFEAEGVWKDWFIKCDADGFSRWYLKPLARYKRSRDNKWFTLMGSINKENIFSIGIKNRLISPTTGELSCFANDVSWAYSNNKGSLTLKITRIA